VADRAFIMRTFALMLLMQISQQEKDAAETRASEKAKKVLCF